MKITELTLTSVMRHTSTKLVFPDRGVVCVTGENGAGKSSIIEAVSAAVWGITLRKTPVWRRTGNGEILALVDVGRETLMVRRRRAKSKVLLDFSSLSTNQVFDTKTKAQEALDAIVGSHARWRRTHAFSSADASHFTLATDAERKKLLEDILGLDRFDAAHASANRDRRQAEKDVATAGSREALAAERVRGAKARLADMQEIARQIPASLPTPLVGVEEHDQIIERANAFLPKYDAKIQEISSDITRRTTLMEQARERAEHVDGIEDCHVCGATIDAAHRKRLHGIAKDIHDEHQSALAKLEVELKKARDARARWREKYAEAREKRREAVQAIKAARGRAEEREKAEERVRNLKQDLEDARDKHDEAVADLAAEEAKLAVIRSAEKVLSLSGVRSYLLGTALAGIEEIANTWLARLVDSDEVRLELKPYSEKASGGIKDSISLDIEGVGEGYGYKATSGGERRRIDLALLFALAEVAEAAAGITTGTMFFDEVFDALDSSGVESAIEVIEELAKDRCVVVITHSPLLAQRLSAAKRWHVSAGEVKEI